MPPTVLPPPLRYLAGWLETFCRYKLFAALPGWGWRTCSLLTVILAVGKLFRCQRGEQMDPMEMLVTLEIC